MGLISSRDFVDLLHVKAYPGGILTTNCELHGTAACLRILAAFWKTSCELLSLITVYVLLAYGLTDGNSSLSFVPKRCFLNTETIHRIS